MGWFIIFKQFIVTQLYPVIIHADCFRDKLIMYVYSVNGSAYDYDDEEEHGMVVKGSSSERTKNSQTGWGKIMNS